jgi:hypothetical protein
VSQTEPSEQPKRETALAFASVPSRDFDGGLLERYTYTLTSADALAYLRLKRDLPGWAKLLFGLWFMLGGLVSGLLPDWLNGPPDSWQSVAAFLLVIAIQFVLLLLARALWRRWRARRMVPTPKRAEFEIWIDCVAGTEIDSKDTDDCAYLSPELIGQVLKTPTHLFILNSNTHIVVPVHAFASASEASQMADQLRELAAGPYYFEA